MLYSYRGYDANMLKCKGNIEASSLDDAKSKLQTQNIIFNSLKQKGDFGLKLDFLDSLRKKKLPIIELSRISKNLSIYLRSGVSLLSAIKLSKTLYEDDKNTQNFLNQMEISLREGNSFYQAMKSQTIYTIPDFYLQSIKISEDNGFLVKVLDELSSYLKNQYKINKQVSSAFVYPIFIVVAAIVMISFMLSFVVPKIAEMFDSIDQELPGITQFVISMGEFFGSYWLVMFILIFGAVIGLSFLYRVNTSFKYSYDSFLLRVPILGKMVLYNELARFSYIGSVMMDSGVSFVHTIKLSTDILTLAPVKKLFERSITKVIEGEKLSSTLIKDHYKIDRSFIQAISLGEETSQLPAILANISELYFDENEEKTKKLMSLLEPTLMLFVALMVGGIVVAMILPIASMNI